MNRLLESREGQDQRQQWRQTALFRGNWYLSLTRVCSHIPTRLGVVHVHLELPSKLQFGDSFSTQYQQETVFWLVRLPVGQAPSFEESWFFLNFQVHLPHQLDVVADSGQARVSITGSWKILHSVFFGIWCFYPSSRLHKISWGYLFINNLLSVFLLT